MSPGPLGPDADAATDPAEGADLARRAGAGAAWLSAALVATSLLQLVSVAVTSRLLAPSEVGLIAGAYLVLRLVTYLATFGVANAIVQRPDLAPGHVAAGFRLSLLFGLAAALLGAAGSPLAGMLLDEPRAVPITAALSASFVLSSFGAVSNALLRRAMDFRAVAIVDVLSYGVGYIVVGIVAVALGAGAWGLVLATLTQALTSSLLSYRLRPHPLSFASSPEERRAVRGFGGRVSLIGFLEFWALQVDSVGVSASRGPSGIGLYSRGSTLVALPLVQLSTLALRVFGPGFSRVRTERTARAVEDVTALVAVAVVPLAAALAVTSALVVDTLLGPDWRSVTAFLPVVLVAAAAQAVTQILAVICEARGLLRDMIVVQALCLLAFIAAVSTLVVVVDEPPLVAFATVWACVEAVRQTMYLRVVTSRLGCDLKRLLRGYAEAFVVAAACAALAYGASLLPGAVGVRAALVAVAFVVAWVAALRALRSSRVREVVRTRGLIDQVPSPRLRRGLARVLA